MLVLIVFGSLRIQSERFHILPPAVGISLLAISLLLSSLIMIWITANWLNKVDEQRALAEAEIRMLNASLKAKVEKTEEKYHSLFEHASDAIYVLSMTGDFMDVNDSTCQLTGYSREELLRMNITALLSAEALKGYKLLFTLIEPGTSVMAERQIITKDGSVVDVEINLKRFVDERILVVARDITTRKRMEAELKLSEQKYRLLFEGNPLPLWIVAKDDMTVIAANAAAAKLYGYTPEELTGMDIKQLRPAAYWGALIANYQADISEPTTFGVVEHIKKDGSPIFVEVVAHDLMFEGRFARLSSTTDMSGKLKAEASLKTSEANLQTILDNTDTAYALLNAELDIVEYNNQAVIFAQNEFNFEPGNGRKVFDLMSENRRQRFIAYTKQVFKGQTISYEISYPQTDGSSLWYYVRMFPIADKGQQILGLVLAITDITERKQAEQSIQAHLAQIREMTWKQSHLIRSPLANLKGLFPLIKTNPTDKNVLTYAEIELERMDQILSEMAEGSALLDPQGDAQGLSSS
jgi:PAS domain S-box-containing protein